MIRHRGLYQEMGWSVNAGLVPCSHVGMGEGATSAGEDWLSPGESRQLAVSMARGVPGGRGAARAPQPAAKPLPCPAFPTGLAATLPLSRNGAAGLLLITANYLLHVLLAMVFCCE